MEQSCICYIPDAAPKATLITPRLPLQYTTRWLLPFSPNHAACGSAT